MDTELAIVYLSLGSNMEDRQENLARALDSLSQRLRIGRVSSVYDTEPMCDTNQHRFLNLACQAYTRLSPAGLLALAKGIEARQGRLPSKPNAPRPIDIDILFYADLVMETPGLVIPHPRLTERAFVLVPMAEIAPDLKHPAEGKTIIELMKGLADVNSVIRL